MATCKEQSWKLLKLKHLTLSVRKSRCLFKMFSVNGVAFHCLSKTLLEEAIWNGFYELIQY